MKQLALIQGLYFVTSGIWPLIHINSFMKVTGPKKDIWLVQTVGVLIIVIGTVLLASSFKGEIEFSARLLAIGSSFGLLSVDCIFVARKIISPIYLLDAGIETILIFAWLG